MNLKNSKFIEMVKQRRAAMGRRGLRRRGKHWLYPVAIERVYEKHLLALVAKLENIVSETLIARLPRLHAQADYTLRSDDFIDDLQAILQAIFVASAGVFEDIEKFVFGIGFNIANFNEAQYQQIIRSTLGVNPLQNDQALQTYLKAFARTNAALIKDIPAKTIKDIEGIATRGLMNGATIKDIEREIQGSFKTTRARARLIARDQTGKLNAALTKERQTRVGINEYIWNSLEDERVRDSHRVLDGMICSWEDDTVYRKTGETKWRSRASIGGYIGTPGSDYQCRCFGEPILEGIIDESEK